MKDNGQVITPFGRPKPDRPTPESFARGLDGACQAVRALSDQLKDAPDTLKGLRAKVFEAERTLRRMQIDVIARASLETAKDIDGLMAKTLEVYEATFGERFEV